MRTTEPLHPRSAERKRQSVAGSGRKNADDALVMALAVGGTVPAAAQHAGVSERTVYRRLHDPAFCRRVSAARAELLERAVGQLVATASCAAATLRQLLAAPADSIKLGAARSILEFGPKLRESTELEARLAALEQQSATPEP